VEFLQRLRRWRCDTRLSVERIARQSMYCWIHEDQVTDSLCVFRFCMVSFVGYLYFCVWFEGHSSVITNCSSIVL
jgi:hypothetical protein